MTSQTFGETIRSLRVSKKLTLKKLSDILKVDVSTLGKIEKNTRYPNSIVISNISKHFHLSEKELHIIHLSDRLAADLKCQKYGREALKLAATKLKRN